MTAEYVSLYGPIAVMLIALAWSVVRVLYLSKSQGVSVLSFMAQRKTTPEKWLAFTAIILDGYLFLRPFIPGLDKTVYAFDFTFPYWGVSTMILGIGLMIICQINMSLSWRIGVPKEKEASQTLVETGVYRYSRNPIYLGIIIFLIGTVITVPGPITIGATILTWLLLQPLVKREEVFLAEAFGDAFHVYCQKVRRWV